MPWKDEHYYSEATFMRRGGIELYFFLALFILIIIATMTTVIIESEQFEPARPQSGEELDNHEAHIILMNLLRTTVSHSVHGTEIRNIMLGEAIALNDEIDLAGVIEQRIPEVYEYELVLHYPQGSEKKYGEEIAEGMVADALIPSQSGNIQAVLTLEEKR